jgi:hypothetical protein
MTLDHVAATYRVPEDELIARLKLPPDTDRKESLKTIADKRGVPRFDYVREVQRVLGQSAPPPVTDVPNSGGLTDRILSALLIYGYPALAATLLLGAIGLPLPIGVATILAARSPHSGVCAGNGRRRSRSSPRSPATSSPTASAAPCA